jgi:hypothetical protein
MLSNSFFVVYPFCYVKYEDGLISIVPTALIYASMYGMQIKVALKPITQRSHFLIVVASIMLPNAQLNEEP